MNLSQGWPHAGALMITMLLLALTGCGSKRSASSSTTMGFPASAYAEWANGPSSDPAYFPVGVWLQSPAHAAAYRNMGVNLYVGLWQGPTQEQLSALAAEGMQTICALNDVGREHLDDPTIVGWMHSDEPDNAQALPEGGWGDAVPIREIQADYATMREQDPTRPVWLNLGQGVANEEWVGRAAPRETYPGYVAGTDIVSFDVYPISGIRKTDGERYMWWVAKGVDSLRHWGQDEKIVWNVIETTRISSDRGPTPDQVNSQVWMSIIHGSRGIVYFAHEWNPVFREARLLEDEQMRQGVATTNAQIHRLAPVLNSAEAEIEVNVTTSDPAIPVHVMTRQYDGDIYLFAAGMRQGSASATFTLVGDGVDRLTKVDVVDEERRLPLTQAEFTDEFDPYAVHIYRLSR